MRRVTMFVGGLAAVLALGAAVAFAAGPLATVASDSATGVGLSGDGFTVSEPVETRDPSIEPQQPEATEPKPDHPDEADEPKEDLAETAEPKDDEPVEEAKDEPVDEEKPHEEADTTPPEIVILHPSDGQVFETERVVFEGEAEPGVQVYAGDWEADVTDDGHWRIVLILQPGSNVATITAVDAAGNEGKDRVQVFFEVAKEDSPAEPPKEDPPKDEKPPHEEEKEKGFTANQLYGTCGEDIPYDVFFGTGAPGTTVTVSSDFGSGTTTVNEHGEWELRVDFPDAPRDEKITVLVTSSDGHVADFWFKATGETH